MHTNDFEGRCCLYGMLFKKRAYLVEYSLKSEFTMYVS